MGRRGPKPEPAAVKIAKGNSARRPIGADQPQQSVARAVTMPTWLKGEGRKIWLANAPRLQAQKLLTDTDAIAFARYCRNLARWLKMQKILDAEGETYESESQHGKLKRAHPAFLISDRLERQLVSAEAVFGLNPAERQRLYAARAAVPPELPFDRAPDKEPDAKAQPEAPASGVIGALH